MIRLPGLSRISGAINSGMEVASLLEHSKFDAVLLYGLPTVGIQTLLAARAHGVPGRGKRWTGRGKRGT